MFLSPYLNAQHFVGTNNSTSNIFRSGRTAFGFSYLPTFDNNVIMINGRSRFIDLLHINGNNVSTLIDKTKLLLGDDFSHDVGPNDYYYIKSEGGIVIQPKTSFEHGAKLAIRRMNSLPAGGGGSFLTFGPAACQYCDSNISSEGDLVIRAHSWGENPKDLIISNDGTGKIKFVTKEFSWSNGGVDQLRMTILKNGKIGIGTETPTELLAVNGTIHAKEIRVDLQDWPDYVFNVNYNLLTIEQVEEFVKEKGHLPDIPNAKEVEENGIKLAEMNKKLLKKIEEMTLYIIDLNNKLKLVEEAIKNK
jgi:hypothetical protein